MAAPELKGCHGTCESGTFHGRAVQVEPIKLLMKAPGTKRENLKCEEPLSNFAFKFNLHPYTTACPRCCATRTRTSTASPTTSA